MKKGFTLLELMLVLAVIVGTVAILLTQFGDAIKTQNSRQLANDMGQLRATIHSLKTPSDGWNNLSSSTTAENVLLMAAGTPAALIRNVDGIQHLATPDGQIITVTGARNYYTISFGEMNPEICLDFIIKNLGRGWSSITVDDTPINDMTEAQAACADADEETSTEVSIVLTGN